MACRVVDHDVKPFVQILDEFLRRLDRGAQDQLVEEGVQAQETRAQVAQVSRPQRDLGGDLRQV